MSTEQVVPSISKGEIFKKEHGYSKSRKRLLDKYNTSNEGYKLIMKERRAVTKKEQRAKADRAKTGKRTKVAATKPK